ncbi:helix-turn-helix domain-containing protein, partial [Ornithinibacillus salinisoli]|uniref:helix-turn-helix domain-containing protein n=1 Tax=Ornithinibacillus salinisoli TaxID=1848459 RepID=UPI003631F436
MSNRACSIELKLEVIQAYKDKVYSLKELCAKYQIHFTSVYEWVEKFEKAGKSGLEESKKWRTYSIKLKEAAVKDYN